MGFEREVVEREDGVGVERAEEVDEKTEAGIADRDEAAGMAISCRRNWVGVAERERAVAPVQEGEETREPGRGAVDRQSERSPEWGQRMGRGNA